LLRLWREGTDRAWHASLQSTKTERVYRFPTIEALFAFLAEQVVDDEDNDVATPDGR
jgi:hypothetical protein